MRLFRFALIAAVLILPRAALASCSYDSIGSMQCSDGTTFERSYGGDTLVGTGADGGPVRGTINHYGSYDTVTTESMIPLTGNESSDEGEY